jgi:hypothetical protein
LKGSRAGIGLEQVLVLADGKEEEVVGRKKTRHRRKLAYL